jgi:uncharacterized membrane protein YedE/YeeE
MSAATIDRIATAPSLRPALNAGPVSLSAVLIALGAVYLAATISWRQSALFMVGVAAGVVLYHAAFGFTSSWRDLIAHGRGEGFRAQMLMLAVTCLVFLPLLARGQFFGHPLRGSVSPVGVSVIVGAFLFGVGMQMGGGCASGTLYTAGGGSMRMFATLAAFIVGSVVGARHMPFWDTAPALRPISLVSRFGLVAALATSLVLFGGLTLISLAIEKRRGVSSAQGRRWNDGVVWLRGPWPLVAGALGLAAVNIATLTLSGRPWGVTSAFALWGSKIAAALGVNVAAWPYWQSPANASALHTSVLTDITSVMDFGIMLGALLAAGLAGRYSPVWRVPARSLAAALFGGLLLGYGARIAYGCNIGAYFSGIASSSVHGWLWFASALLGNVVGTRIRPIFGLKV